MGETGQNGDLNPEGCKVFAALARDLLHLDKNKPDKTMFAIFYRPDGYGYAEQCPWRELGIIPLAPLPPDTYNIRFFTAPRYSPDGKSASVIFVTEIFGVGMNGKTLSPIKMMQTCLLSKPTNDWHLDRCQPSAIS